MRGDARFEAATLSALPMSFIRFRALPVTGPRFEPWRCAPATAEGCSEVVIAEGDAAEVMGGPEAWLRGEEAPELARAFAGRLREAGGFRLIYADPPYACGQDFGIPVSHSGRKGRSDAERVAAFSDRWKGGPQELVAYLRPRLERMRDLLTDDGSLYLHVDHRLSPHARLLMDDIFGADRLRGVIVWQTGTGAKGRRQWTQQHQEILCYSRGASFVFRPNDPALREPYAATSLATHFRARDADGRRYRERRINGRTYRYYADEGRLVGSVWTDLPAMLGASPILAESTGYPTQKPVALLRRIIAASTEPGDLVADFFAGSGTTAEAALGMGRGAMVGDLGTPAVITMERRLVGPGRATTVLETRGSDEASAVEDSALAPILELEGTGGNRIHLRGLRGADLSEVMGWAVAYPTAGGLRRHAAAWRTFGGDDLQLSLGVEAGDAPPIVMIYDRWYRRHRWELAPGG